MPEVYEAILEADRQSQERFAGHGSALAQAYNHMIMPLANAARQVHPGALGHPRLRAPLRPRAGRDVAAGDRRRPARRWRSWPSMGSGSPSSRPTRPAACARIGDTQTGRTSTAAASTRPRPYQADAAVGPHDRGLLLRRADLAGGRLRAAAGQRRTTSPSGSWARSRRCPRPGRSWSTSPPTARPTATITATATWRWPTRCATSSRNSLARLTNYGEFLEQHPPTHEVRDRREHLLELRPRRRALAERLRLQHRRAPGLEPGLAGAAARRPRLAARRAGAAAYEARAAELSEGPLGGPRRLHRRHPRPLARRASSDSSSEHAARELSEPSERVAVLKLLELQRHAMLMYTSCGWFFDDLSGIETVQVIQYAGRAVQLAAETLSASTWSQPSWSSSKRAKSNLPEHGDAAAHLREVRSSRPWSTCQRWPRTTPSARCSRLTGTNTRIYCYARAMRTTGGCSSAGQAKLRSGGPGSPPR